MKKIEKIRKITFVLLTVLLVGAVACNTQAGTSKTAIKACSITVNSIPVAGESPNEDSLSISVSGTGFTLDSYEETNEVFCWEGGEIPEVTIYLNAKDSYYFAITKASQIKLAGCEFVSAKRQNSASTLVVCVKLKKAVGYRIDEVEKASISEKLVCTWDPVYDAGSYEVRLMKDGAIVGGTQTTTDTKLDCALNANRSGNYCFKVRAVHKNDPEVKGEWKMSDEVYISDADAKKYKEAAEAAMSAGTWISDKTGTKFKLPDGTFVTNAWRKINKKWYYFRPDGNRATGWAQIDGCYYYFDPATGEMAVNTKIDGYEIDINGRRVEK